MTPLENMNESIWLLKRFHHCIYHDCVHKFEFGNENEGFVGGYFKQKYETIDNMYVIYCGKHIFGLIKGFKYDIGNTTNTPFHNKLLDEIEAYDKSYYYTYEFSESHSDSENTESDSDSENTESDSD